LDIIEVLLAILETVYGFIYCIYGFFVHVMMDIACVAIVAYFPEPSIDPFIMQIELMC
jgi:hypothetical protein